MLIDPNTLSSDGTIALTGMSFSEDGRYMAYATSASGSDWLTWRVRDVATRTDLDDEIRWSKFSGAAWLLDGSGFYYSRYAEPDESTAIQGRELRPENLPAPHRHARSPPTRSCTSGPIIPIGT